MNDFDTQHGAPTIFGDDATDASTQDLATASSDSAALTDDEAAARARVMRANLDQFALDEEDLALLSGEAQLSASDEVTAGLPVLAVVGRPNVGKSTLVNRILGRREAVVQDTPGVTRDRVSYRAEWAGRDFTLVDTGGWEIDVKGLDRSVAEQAEIAVDLADAVVLVLDATVGVTASDERIVDMLRSKEKPIILAANKVDSPVQEADAAYLWSLGLGEPYPISALHGRGSGDVLDAAMAILPEVSAVAGPAPAEGSLHRVALVGRPNVGKSSLLNSIAGYLLIHALTTRAFKGDNTNPKSLTVKDGAQYPLLLGDSFRLHLGFVVALVAALLVWWLMERSEFGFQFRARRPPAPPGSASRASPPWSWSSPGRCAAWPPPAPCSARSTT